jgi:hydrogenase/urease accessory protein HupE
MLSRRLIIALWLAVGLVGVARADVFRPAYLELTEVGDGRYEVLWKVPALADGRRLSASVVFPPETRVVTPPRGLHANGAWTERYSIEREGGLVGQTVVIDGLAGGVSDVIARLVRLDGSTQVEQLRPERPRFEVRAPAGKAEIAWAYLVLGVEHILGGVDHLLFVLALLLIVRGTRRIVATITAFTLAHSLTLAAATLGWVRVPVPPVEAAIALSIVFVCGEVIHGLRGRPGLAARAPWTVAFLFGLLHGLGFASALAEVGLPQTAIPLALFMFNVGVELGQLLFVAAVLALGALTRGWLVRAPVRATALAAYAIGAVAAFWTVERVAGFWA